MSTTFKATIEHVNHTTSRATVRTHTVLVDRGIAKGGLDLGPAGGEYLLVSLGGCLRAIWWPRFVPARPPCRTSAWP